jgi:hypothetical protein
MVSLGRAPHRSNPSDISQRIKRSRGLLRCSLRYQVVFHIRNYSRLRGPRKVLRGRRVSYCRPLEGLPKVVALLPVGAQVTAGDRTHAPHSRGESRRRVLRPLTMGMSCSAWLLVVLDCGFEIVVDLDRQASRVEAGMAKWDSWDKLNRQKKVSKFDYLEEREAKASKSGSSTYYHPRSAKYKRARPKPNSYHYQ